MASVGLTRRDFLGGGLGTIGAGLLGGSLALPLGCFVPGDGGADFFGELLPPDAFGLRLPPGFTSRIVAVSTFAVAGTSHA